MKYVMVNHFRPVIFDDDLPHNEFENLPGRITSAGFVKMNEGNYECYGKSLSLGLEPAPRDTEIINRFLKGE